ncbi:MAG: hypothetical protein ACE5EK_11015, partial [Nitrospinales bacterium]
MKWLNFKFKEKLCLSHVLVPLFLFTLFSGALTPLPAEGQERLQTLEKEIEKLKKAYRNLTKPKVRSDFDIPKLSIRGFGHLQYDVKSSTLKTGGVDTGHDNTNNFTNGGVDLFITSQISSKLSFLNETVFEFGPGGQNILDVERVMLKYDFANWLNVGLGRGHTALGYWNQRFHHGTWLHTTTDRPIIYRFEDDGGILPVHFVGLEFSGTLDFDLGAFSYIGNVGNGRGAITDSVQLVEDLNDEKQLSFMFTVEPAAIEGLGIGANILYDVIPKNADVATRNQEINETIVGTHLFYIDELVELIMEVQYIHHELGFNKDHYGAYAQFALTFGDIKPYYRFDALRIDEGDPFFDGLAEVEDSDLHTFGVRYDWFPF